MSVATDRLYFFVTSAVRPPAGKGRHEEVADPPAYKALGSSPNWRRALDDSWECGAPIIFRGLRYATASHAYLAQKVYHHRIGRLGVGEAAAPVGVRPTTAPFQQSQAAAIFSLDRQGIFGPESRFAETPTRSGIGAYMDYNAYVRTYGPLSPSEKEEWRRVRDDLRAQILFCKFSQISALRALLIATGEAQLWHMQPPAPAKRDLELERVRAALWMGFKELPFADEPDSDLED